MRVLFITRKCERHLLYDTYYLLPEFDKFKIRFSENYNINETLIACSSVLSFYYICSISYGLFYCEGKDLQYMIYIKWKMKVNGRLWFPKITPDPYGWQIKSSLRLKNFALSGFKFLLDCSRVSSEGSSRSGSEALINLKSLNLVRYISKIFLWETPNS